MRAELGAIVEHSEVILVPGIGAALEVSLSQGLPMVEQFEFESDCARHSKSYGRAVTSVILSRTLKYGSVASSEIEDGTIGIGFLT